ncbi:hypothetical protein EDC01DRAFT_109458 [Geopyxis carbonaria]|nr:hypothetical protein EDC01DRAFT_109458 [Geopyxis carbonaria]
MGLQASAGTAWMAWDRQGRPPIVNMVPNVSLNTQKRENRCIRQCNLIQPWPLDAPEISSERMRVCESDIEWPPCINSAAPMSPSTLILASPQTHVPPLPETQDHDWRSAIQGRLPAHGRCAVRRHAYDQYRVAGAGCLDGWKVKWGGIGPMDKVISEVCWSEQADAVRMPALFDREFLSRVFALSRPALHRPVCHPPRVHPPPPPRPSWPRSE